MKTYISEYDKSVNFVADNMQESRFVQRTEDYFIVYLSSQNGCNKSCRFCHLTQTGQTEFVDTTLEEFVHQAKFPIEHYKSLVNSGQPVSKKVNFNFMARGEVFSNQWILNNAPQLIRNLENTLIDLDLNSKFNFSTIGPLEIKNKDFSDILDISPQSMIYYSLYSVNPTFRKRWLPKALPVETILEKLKKWQEKGGEVAFHWAFIEGENDSVKDLKEIISALKDFDIQGKFNLVRYNPYSILQGKEPSEQILNRNFEILSDYFQNPNSRIVPRVGFDVKASCGMFVS